MPREHSKGKQPSVEPADFEEEDAGEGTSGEISRELVSSTVIKHLSVPGFLAVQVHKVNSMISRTMIMMDIKTHV